MRTGVKTGPEKALLAEQLTLNAALPWLLTFYSKQPGPQNDTCNVGQATYCFPSRALLNLKPDETLFPLLPQHPLLHTRSQVLAELP